MELKVEFYIVLLMIKLVHGVKVMTTFTKVAGDGDDVDISCTRTANDREYLASMIDASNRCTRLDWNWGSAPSYETGATYYEKRYSVEIYETPMVLQKDEPIRLPIRFVAGSSIDMHITFMADTFTFGFIELVDTMDESGTGNTVMIRMAMTPAKTDYVTFKTWKGSWKTQGIFSPYPFPAGTTHKVTFMALTTETQILVNDVEAVKYTHIVPPEDARMLTFSNTGMLLEKIEFNGK